MIEQKGARNKERTEAPRQRDGMKREKREQKGEENCMREGGVVKWISGQVVGDQTFAFFGLLAR
jgi:hypothetical protein